MSNVFVPRPRLALIAGLLFLGSLLVACGDTATATTAPVPATATTVPAPATATTAGATGGSAAGPIAVTLNEWSIQPASIDVAAGHQTFKVTNSGRLPHNFTIMVNGQKVGTPNIAGGQTATLEADLTAGTYDTLCTIPGHKEQGMAGKVVVK